VERDLRVTVEPVKKVVGPNDEIEVDVTTVDQLGRPVAAELSLALVDRSLLRLYQDRQPDIGAFFYDQTRTGTSATQATNTFKYEPGTVAVSEAVVEEAERQLAINANEVEKRKIRERWAARMRQNGYVSESFLRAITERGDGEGRGQGDRPEANSDAP